MLGWFLRLGLDEYGALEADLVLVFDNHFEKSTHMVQFEGQVGVQQGFITFASTPQDIVLPAELVRCIDAGFHRGSSVGKDLGIGVGRCACHPSAVAEEVRGPPQHTCSRCFNFFADVVGDLIKRAKVFGKTAAFGADIRIMPAKEGLAENLEELESGIGLEASAVHAVLGKPRTGKRRSSKLILTFPGKAVPIGDRKPQMVFHALAEDHFIGIIVSKLESVGAVGSRKSDPLDILKKSGAHRSFLSFWSPCSDRTDHWSSLQIAFRRRALHFAMCFTAGQMICHASQP